MQERPVATVNYKHRAAFKKVCFLPRTKTLAVLISALFSVPAGCADRWNVPDVSLDKIMEDSKCEPGLLLSELSDRRKIGLLGSPPERLAELYDEYFIALRSCGRAETADFPVPDEWVSNWFGFPDLPPIPYRLEKARSGTVCVTRSGAEQGSDPSEAKWYCEKIGWVDTISGTDR